MATQLLRLPQLRQRVPFSRATIYEKIATGDFPRPIKIGSRAVAWRSEDIDKWIEARAKATKSGEEK